MDSETLIRIAIYICAAVTAIFLIEAVYLAASSPISRKRGVNRRVRAINEGLVGEQALLSLKVERGIFTETLEFAGWYRRLLIQSGMAITLGRFLILQLMLFAAAFVGLETLTTLPTYYCVAIAAFIGFAIPLQVVRSVRAKRQAAFAGQLPDALDVVVRSLRSGHPVPVSLAMVGREMPDPVGTEFGITIDEMTYGLDMPRALRNLADRVGVADMSLLVTAVSIQATSGGNLAEILANLSKVLRDRFQLRRKVRALSAEGRFSAYGLTILPILIFLAIFLQSPGYYIDVMEEPVFLPAMICLVIWSILGDLMMYKMINFKF
jgi:tight adherence protein B